MYNNIPSNWFYTNEETEKPYTIAALPTFTRTRQLVLPIGAVLPATNSINYNEEVQVCSENPPSFIGGYFP